MRIELIVSLLLFTPSAFANCIDLSHKYLVSLTEVRMQQVGCEKFERQLYYMEESLGDKESVAIDGEWKSDAVDDEFEAFTRQIRWSWNSQKTSLIYDFFINGGDKKSGDQYVMNGAQIYTLDPAGVKVEEFIQKRVTKQDGSTQVTQTKTEDIRSPLK